MWVLFVAVKRGQDLFPIQVMKYKTLGTSDVAVEYKGRYHVIEFQVIDADVIPVLGLQTITDLQLIQRLFTVHGIKRYTRDQTRNTQYLCSSV